VARYLVENQFKELQLVHKNLILKISDNVDSHHLIGGLLSFDHSDSKYPIKDEFKILIIIPNNYPHSLPEVIESGGRIPHINKHHVNPDELGTLCLASRRQKVELFSKNPSLLGFTEKLLIPFLYSFCCYAKYGVRPFGELSHGPLGLLEDYKKSFKLRSKKEVCDFILYLISLHDNPEKRFKVRTRSKCPCGSKKRFNECHMKYYEILGYYSKRELNTDYEDINKLKDPSST